jgi:hypothetical protein
MTAIFVNGGYEALDISISRLIPGISEGRPMGRD